MAQIEELNKGSKFSLRSYFSCLYKGEQTASKEQYLDGKLNPILSHNSSVFSPSLQNYYHLRKEKQNKLVLTLFDHRNTLLKAFILLSKTVIHLPDLYPA